MQAQIPGWGSPEQISARLTNEAVAFHHLNLDLYLTQIEDLSWTGAVFYHKATGDLADELWDCREEWRAPLQAYLDRELRGASGGNVSVRGLTLEKGSIDFILSLDWTNILSALNIGKMILGLAERMANFLIGWWNKRKGRK